MPILYEIPLRTWLRELSAEAGKPITLENLPDSVLDDWVGKGFSHIWFMGAWDIGPDVRAHALREWEAKWRKEIPSTEQDVIGSPFAIRDVVIAPEVGASAHLANLCERMEDRDLGLILDFIPNHLGLDTPLAFRHPHLFVQSSSPRPGTVTKKTRFGKRHFAHGRDPYFPPWTDTLQLDHRISQLHSLLTQALLPLSGLCHGFRCDMAMLLLPEIFEETWRSFPPVVRDTPENFWEHFLAVFRRHRPGFHLIAEAYWGKEAKLQELGFDWTYNKPVRDLLIEKKFGELQDFLNRCTPEYLRRSVHFLENHDEQRIASILTLPEHKASSLLIMGLPGLPLLHDGQLTGRKAFAPIQLAKRLPEEPNAEIRDFYDDLLRALQLTHVQKGDACWISPKEANPGDASFRHCFGSVWKQGAELDVVAVNMGSVPARCVLGLGESLPISGDLHDPSALFQLGEVGGSTQMKDGGLVLELPPLSGRIVRLAARTAG